MEKTSKYIVERERRLRAVCNQLRAIFPASQRDRPVVDSYLSMSCAFIAAK